jgi:hypothetical protein
LVLLGAAASVVSDVPKIHGNLWHAYAVASVAEKKRRDMHVKAARSRSEGWNAYVRYVSRR